MLYDVCVEGGGAEVWFFTCTITIFSHIFCFLSFLRAPVHVLSYLLDGFRDGENCSSLEHIFFSWFVCYTPMMRVAECTRLDMSCD